MLDETGLGSRAAHVEAQQTIDAQSVREPTARKSAGSRAGLHETDRTARSIVS